ncbi:DUF2254 family protein [Streptomyces sp. NPDC058279]|uniref:DUF2254 family protein n=1 Tax=Streptomyces sp. NPDC058279 TaxID=3346418 RepID=UPI0036E65BF1
MIGAWRGSSPSEPSAPSSRTPPSPCASSWTIAIRALPPAVNDPTTAVQVLNHTDTFLHVVGRPNGC